MKCHALVIMILLALLAPLTARQVWTEALPVVENENMDFNGAGSVLADGSYLLAWTDYSHLEYQSRYMRYSSNHQELWDEPLVLAEGYVGQVHATGDGGFVVIYSSSSSSYMMIRKFDSSGVPLWNNQAYPLGILHTNYLVSVAEDQSGGLWVICTSQSRNVTYHYFNASGIPTVPAGTEVPFGWFGSRLNIIACPSGGAVLSFIRNHEVWLYRIAQNQSIVWEQTASAQPYTYLNQLVQDGPNGFFLVFGYNSLWARRYNFSGEQLWPSEVQIGSGTLSGSSNFKAWRAQDGSVKGVWLSSEGLRIGGISASGTQLPELPALNLNIGNETRLYETHLLSGPGEPAYVSLYADNDDSFMYLACRFDNSGFLDAQPLQLAIAPHYPMIYPMPWFGVVETELQCVYPHAEPSQLRLMRASCDSAGTMASVQINISPYGYFNEQVIASSQQQLICAWLETDITGSSSINHKRTRYQLYSQAGTAVLPQPGILPGSGTYSLISSLKALGLANGQFMLFWKESSSPNLIRAQLISSSGTPLWEPEGRIMLERSISNYCLSQVNGNIFIAFDNGGSVVGLQKISSGQAIWGHEGIVLANDSVATGLVQLLDLQGDYLVYGFSLQGSVYTGYECIKVLRFSSEGMVLPEFGQNGISFLPMNGAIKIIYDKTLLTPQGLLLRFGHGFEYQGDEGPYMVIQDWIGHLVGAQGSTPWGSGYPNFRVYLLGADDTGFYIRKPLINYSQVAKYDYNFQQLWSENCNIDSSDLSPGDYGAKRLSNGTWIGIGHARFNESGSSSIGTNMYYSFDSDGGVQVPSDSRLEERCEVSNLCMTSMGDAVYAIWGLNGGSGNYTHLYMQKLNADPVATDDPVVPAPYVTLLGSYPNPFQTGVTIDLKSTRKIACELCVYNLRGQKVKKLMSGRVEPGSFSYTWDAKDEAGSTVASGIYFLRLKAEGHKPLSRKIIKLN